MQKKQKKSRFEELRQQIPQEMIKRFQKQQNFLKTKLISQNKLDQINFICGLDISFSQKYQNIAIASIIIFHKTIKVTIYEDSIIVKLNIPYIPGLLAFRQVPACLELFKRLKQKQKDIYPDVILIDGNGILHSNQFGLASHLGVLLQLPTIGCGKTMFYIDGLTKNKVAQLSKKHLNAGDYAELIGQSGKIWGAAMKMTQESSQPMIISTGHMITLEKAIQVIKFVSLYRVPQPIRLADKLSRHIVDKIKEDDLQQAMLLDMPFMSQQ